MKKRLALIVLILLAAATAGRVEAQRAMTPADTLRVAGVGDPQISPDGEWVVYTVSTVEGNATQTTLWLARIRPATSIQDIESTAAERGRTTEPLLPVELGGSNPRWSPDGKRIAFLASKGEQSGIWVMTLAQRQPRFVAPVRASNFFITYAGESISWSPDSRRIAFINATEEAVAVDSGEAARPAGARGVGADDPRVVDRIQYKSRTSFSDRRRTHVFVADVDAALAGDDAAIRQLTSGPYYDHALTWSPRGDEVAFLSNHEADPDAVNNSDIFAVDMNGRVRQITETKGCEYEPAWSPDGKWIAYTATKRDVTTIDSVAEDTHVWVIEANGRAGRELTAAQDRRARSPRWMADSRSILFLASDRGRTSLYRIRVNVNDDRPEPLQLFLYLNLPKFPSGLTDNFGEDGQDLTTVANSQRAFQIYSFSVAYQKRLTRRSIDGSYIYLSPIAFVLSTPTSPSEVCFQANVRPVLQCLSNHNSAIMKTMELVEPEEINFKSFDGTPIQGWLMKPLNWRADRRYPLILSIHGGPHGMYGHGFNATFQAYATRGYAVLYLNPRGSSGYGQKFSDGTLREWGGGDYRDLMLGVDEVLRTRSWIDPERLGVTGGSYGGFMTNWIVTQTTRFRAAVAHASVSNLISFYATSLYQDLIHAEFGGFPWDDYDLLWRWSPLRYVKQAQTPVLFTHGEQDNDVHITQAEEMYTALRRRGIESVLVRYPREGHGLREPLHRLDALERTLAWFDKYLR
ncbi:MAG TPA: S9 family peptidase [Pyrinomonadaceae bacterium]|nr:S9 family peptidase [Pyrinomonadaceae bacterium]